METIEGRWTEEDRKALRNILDRNDMTIHTSKQDNELVSEIEFYSDLGEDFIMTFSGTARQRALRTAYSLTAKTSTPTNTPVCMSA